MYNNFDIHLSLTFFHMAFKGTAHIPHFQNLRPISIGLKEKFDKTDDCLISSNVSLINNKR